jgi:hypothetical protein
MLFVAVLERNLFRNEDIPPLSINPAKGVDLPDLDLGVKSPSENYCTSEPFFSAYERLLGSEYDVVVLLTDYQTAKRGPPLRLQLINWRYLTKTRIADRSLCCIARRHRDWLARKILALVNDIQNEEQVCGGIDAALKDFDHRNTIALSDEKPLMPDSYRIAIEQIRKTTPLHLGVIDAADNWVIETQKDAGRPPNDNEWNRLKRSPLDGLIGMSFALQWRYNFGRLFNADT